MSEIKKYCTVEEAAEILDKNKHTIRAMFKDGRIKGKQFGEGSSPIFIELESLEEWKK